MELKSVVLYRFLFWSMTSGPTRPCRPLSSSSSPDLESPIHGSTTLDCSTHRNTVGILQLYKMN